jgi:uncharacterized protein YkwD
MQKPSGILSFFLFIASTFSVLGDSSSLSKLEQEVVRELNFARTQPSKYAAIVEETKQYYQGKRLKKSGQIAIMTKEGVRAVEEAVRFLEDQEPLSPLRISAGISRAAEDHIEDQSESGGLGHDGGDGSEPWDRMNRYGKWKKTVGENISYGPKTARDIVIQLIVDDGIRDRGHRKNIFKENFGVVGVAVGAHPRYGQMCVMDFAGDFVEK